MQLKQFFFAVSILMKAFERHYRAYWTIDVKELVNEIDWEDTTSTFPLNQRNQSSEKETFV